MNLYGSALYRAVFSKVFFYDGLRPGEAHVTLCFALLCDTCSNSHCSCSLVLIFQAGFYVTPRVERPRCGEQDVVRYVATNCMFSPLFRLLC